MEALLQPFEYPDSRGAAEACASELTNLYCSLERAYSARCLYLNSGVGIFPHQPFHLEEAEKNGVDLQLSGHTHYGQMWPFNYITKMVYELAYGYLVKGGDARLRFVRRRYVGTAHQNCRGP